MSNKLPNPDYVFKVVMVGDPMVGKTCLASRFCTDTFPDMSQSTVGADYHSRALPLDGAVVRMQIWDTAGQEAYRCVVPLYYRLACGVVVVYDTTDAASFDHVPFWLAHSERHREPGAQVLLLGNKCDCAKGRGARQVQKRAAQRFAEARGIAFFETSAKSGTNVREAFVALGRACKHSADAQADRWSDGAVMGLELGTGRARGMPAQAVSSCC